MRRLRKLCNILSIRGITPSQMVIVVRHLIPAFILTVISFLPAAGIADPLACNTPQPAEQAELAARGIESPAAELILGGVVQVNLADGHYLLSTWKPCARDLESWPRDRFRVVIALHRLSPEQAPIPVATGSIPQMMSARPSMPAVVETAGGRFIAVETWNGGNCTACEALAIFREAGGALVALEPPAGTVLRSLSDDGSVSGIDARWMGFAGTCRACSPYARLHYVLKSQELAEACTVRRDAYQAEADAGATQLMGDPAAFGDAGFGIATSGLLARTNAGLSAAEIAAAFDYNLARLMELSQLTPERLAAGQSLRAALLEAERNGALNRGCPALGLEPPAGR